MSNRRPSASVEDFAEAAAVAAAMSSRRASEARADGSPPKKGSAGKSGEDADDAANYAVFEVHGKTVKVWRAKRSWTGRRVLSLTGLTSGTPLPAVCQAELVLSG